jgi:Putative F0F1-ATPase subunit Ca2+/Mg2+ transporter
MSEPARSRPAHLQILAVSWNFGWPVAAGVALGHWIDEALGSSPAATLVLGLSRQEQDERRQDEVRERAGQDRERVNDPPRRR